MDDSPPSMTRSVSEIISRPSHVPKKKVFGLSLLSEEHERSSSFKSAKGSSADVSETEEDSAFDEFDVERNTLPVSEKRWSSVGTWSERMYQDSLQAEQEFGDEENDEMMIARDGWEQHGCDDDFEEDKVEDVDRDARRCHSLSDLDYLEEVVNDVEDRFLEVKEMVDGDVAALMQDAEDACHTLNPAGDGAEHCALALQDVVRTAQDFITLSDAAADGARGACLLAMRRCRALALELSQKLGAWGEDWGAPNFYMKLLFVVSRCSRLAYCIQPLDTGRAAETRVPSATHPLSPSAAPDDPRDRRSIDLATRAAVLAAAAVGGVEPGRRSARTSVDWAAVAGSPHATGRQTPPVGRSSLSGGSASSAGGGGLAERLQQLSPEPASRRAGRPSHRSSLSGPSPTPPRLRGAAGGRGDAALLGVAAMGDGRGSPDVMACARGLQFWTVRCVCV
jgi:hypothetical protein